MANPSTMTINWRGGQVRGATTGAVKKGIDDTMAAAAISAKSSHPGWRNRTGAAEGSVGIIAPARERGDGVVGEWGSKGVNYVIWLELKRGSFLRNAGDKEYPNLVGRIKQHMGGLV